MMARTRILVGLLLTITLAPTSARALVFARDLPFPLVEDIEIANGLAYLVSRSFSGSGIPTLRILDLSDPSTPVEIGSLDTSLGSEDVEVVGNLAYITDRAIAGNLRIIDVSDPKAPIEIGAFASTFQPIDVEIMGNFAYLADQFWSPRGCGGAACGSAFRVIDVTNPAAPAQVFESFLGLTSDMEAADDVVHILGRDLEEVDVSNPAAPVGVGALPEVFAEEIELVGQHLYTASRFFSLEVSSGSPGGVEIIDVADPANPTRVGSSSAKGNSIAVVGGFAYTGGDGMDVVDVSDPAAPKRRGSIYSEPSNDVAAYGGYAYLAEENQFRVIDLSVLDTPAEVGSAVVDEPFRFANDVAVSDGFAHLAIGDPRFTPYPPGGLRIFDVTDPTTPVAMGGIDTAGAVLDVELAGELVYAAAEIDGLRIFDVSTPSAPAAAGGLALPGSTAKVAVVGDIAYVVDRGIRFEAPVALRVLDVSEPSAPSVLSTVKSTKARFPCKTAGISVVEKLVYVTCNGLHIVDVSDPAQPALVFAGGPSNLESSIDVEGDLAYIGSEPSWLRVLDISNPAAPVEVFAGPGGGRAIVVADGFAHNANDFGLAVHDLADPLQPVLMGGFPAERGRWNGLALADGLVFGAASQAGLQIVDLGPEYSHALSVEIAIRADGEPAVVNLASRGVIPVTVLGAADFDVAEIDRSTLRFGPAPAAPAHRLGGHIEDANGDGHPDLVSHYWIQDCGISETDAKTCVAGQTFAGTPFEGCGAIEATLPGGSADASGLAN